MLSIVILCFIACPPGYYGNNCSEVCSAPYFGLGCNQKCECNPCHHIHGCRMPNNTTGTNTFNTITLLKKNDVSMSRFDKIQNIWKNKILNIVINRYQMNGSDLTSFKWLISLFVHITEWTIFIWWFIRHIFPRGKCYVLYYILFCFQIL